MKHHIFNAQGHQHEYRDTVHIMAHRDAFGGNVDEKGKGFKEKGLYVPG